MVRVSTYSRAYLSEAVDTTWTGVGRLCVASQQEEHLRFASGR